MYREQYARYQSYFEERLNELIASHGPVSDTLHQSCAYSLLAGGKRVRPVLILSVAEALGADVASAVTPALSIEMIHTYSLIHDDLPAMDNDDFRRGKPTNHKVFGEAMAILAGDALLNGAYELLLKNKQYDCAEILANASGASGMVGGQALDVLSENAPKSLSRLTQIHENKTGKLITAAFLMGEVVAKGIQTAQMQRLGETVGMLFQITDDILDVTGSFSSMGKTLGKDEAENKITSVSVMGLHCANELADELLQKALSLLPQCGLDTDFFRSFLQKIRTRER